jgi:hypothetical protein
MRASTFISLSFQIICLHTLLGTCHQFELESSGSHSCVDQIHDKEMPDSILIADLSKPKLKPETTISAVKIEDAFSRIDQQKFSINPRGPRVHGFQLGMTYESFVNLFKTLTCSEFSIGLGNYSEGEINIGDYVGISNLIIRYAGFATTAKDVSDIPPGLEGRGLFDLNDELIGPASLTFIVAGDNKSVVYFSLERRVLEKLFKIATLSYDEFVQKFINAYRIPKLKVVRTGMSSEYLTSYYIDENGWKIIFNGYDNKIKSVQFKVASKETEQGFGK